MNICALTGRLTSAPELKKTNSGVSVTCFSLAVDRKYTPAGQERATDFIDCVAWRNTAEFVTKYFEKGSMIAIEGEIQTRTYTDKNGNKRKAVEVVVSNVSFCGSKQSGNNQAAETEEVFEDASAVDMSDLPF